MAKKNGQANGHKRQTDGKRKTAGCRDGLTTTTTTKQQQQQNKTKQNKTKQNKQTNEKKKKKKTTTTKTEETQTSVKTAAKACDQAARSCRSDQRYYSK